MAKNDSLKDLDVLIYLRKSRSEEQGDSVEETLQKHKDILLSYAQLQGMHIVHTYEEVVSGESLYARPQMLALLEAVGNGDCDAVLVMDIDRLGRGGMKDQGIILDTFKHSNTLIITPDKTYNLNDETDEELTEFKTFMSRRELKIITKRLKRGIKQTIQNGGYIANAPYGYQKATKDKKPTLVIDEEEAYFVRMMFDLYVTQGVGCSTIADTLNALGAKPRRSDKFCRTSVRHILKNPVFIGKIVWDKKKHVRKGTQGNEKNVTIYQPKDQWTVVDGMHPPIVSEEIFNKAQDIFTKKYIPSSNDGTIRNPLAGLVKCKKCGMNMQRMGDNHGQPYLLCNTKNCVAGAKFQFVEQSVLDQLTKMLYALEAGLPTTPKKDVTVLEKSLEACKRELDVLEKQKSSLHDLLEQGVYDITTFQVRKKELEDRLLSTHAQLFALKTSIHRAKNEDTKKLIAKIKSVLGVYNTADAQKKNQLLKSVIENITYVKEKKTAPLDFSLTITLKSF